MFVIRTNRFKEQWFPLGATCGGRVGEHLYTCGSKRLTACTWFRLFDITVLLVIPFSSLVLYTVFELCGEHVLALGFGVVFKCMMFADACIEQSWLVVQACMFALGLVTSPLSLLCSLLFSLWRIICHTLQMSIFASLRLRKLHERTAPCKDAVSCATCLVLSPQLLTI